MSCTLRSNAVSPPKLDDPRTHGSRSEGIHRAKPLVFWHRDGASHCTLFVLIPKYPAHLR
jgi:hypothetical protein